MARLRESDFAKVLDVLHAAGEVEGAVAFPRPVLDAPRELVRATSWPFTSEARRQIRCSSMSASRSGR